MVFSVIDALKFVKEHVPLCVCTLGIAVLGYLGYRAVCWLNNKCQKTEKIEQISQKSLGISSKVSNGTSSLGAVSSRNLSVNVAWLEALPDSLLKPIFGFLPAEQIVQCRRISKRFRDATYKDFPHAPEIERAREYGYRGVDLQEANAHIQMVLRGVKQLVNLKEKYPWCKRLMSSVECKKANGDLDCEATLRKLMFLALSKERKKPLRDFLFKMSGENVGIEKEEEVASVLMTLGIKPDFFVTWETSETPLHKAANARKVEMVKILLAYGADPNRTIPQTGEPPLKLAACWGKEGAKEVVELLIAAGVDPNVTDNRGVTPLLETVGWNGFKNIEVIQILLKHRADPNASDNLGHSPLLFATACGKAEIVEILIKNGADINAKTVGGCTVLAYAASVHKSEMVTLLLRNGADPNLEDDQGRSPLFLAIQEGKQRLFREKLWKRYPQEKVELDLDIVKIVQELLNAGADANTPMPNESLPLHLAAENGFIETTKLLLSAKTDINAKGYGGRTALAFAASNGHFEIIKLLLDMKADRHIPDSNGNTPFQLAKKMKVLDLFQEKKPMLVELKNLGRVFQKGNEGV